MLPISGSGCGGRTVLDLEGHHHIEGTIVVLEEDGPAMTQPETKRPGMIKLCGCGRSETKPFCDGSHKK
ncbi:MAG: CDGSH iron-sulfur domain-containing protein [Gemmatimonadales bacterium]